MSTTETTLPRIVDGALASEHTAPPRLLAFVGPTTGAEFNTIGERLIPKGCFRLEDLRFEFDSSFILPDVAPEMVLLADLIDQHTLELPGPPAQKIRPPLSVFGHADPVGNDDYNKKLSGRRATAVYAMLVRDTDLWEDLHSQPQGGDNWGHKSVQTMLGALGHDPGPADAHQTPQSRDAVKAYQTSNGLPADGLAGPATRKALFRDYMDFLCGPRLLLSKEKDFLGRHKDPQGKADYQGCSEFNPVRMFSEEESQRFAKAPDKTERNSENAPNRRVMILLFAPGRKVNPQFWPCPKAKEGVGACKKRFFPDADKRRSFQAQRREFDKTKDTFACRFYQIISDDSPCERFLTTFVIRVYDLAGKFIPFAPFQLTAGGRKTTGQADAKGVVTAQDVEVPDRGLIEWGYKPKAGQKPEFVFSLDVFLAHDELSKEDEAKQKLHNLGYPEQNDLKTNVTQFQQDYGQLAKPPLKADGELNDPTMKLIRDVHKSCEDDLRKDTPKST